MSMQQLANTIRFLSADAIEKSQSGHPGMPLGMADIATVLWKKHLKFNPTDPCWWDRDRFVLSNGHGSMLLYALLHLTGYDLSMEQLKSFRQWGSQTPGHPEWHETSGVETTTGPLGQGLANAVGMALAEQLLASHYNDSNLTIFNHHTYAFVGDGCLMEGISHEVSALAGTLELGKLIVFWDDNQISIDGNTQGWFTEDIPARYRAYGWHVIQDVDGHDYHAIDQAIHHAKAHQDQPTLICCKTTIGAGAPNKAGSASTHGAPLGQQEVAAMRKHLDWPYPPFELPDAITKQWDHRQQGQAAQMQWQKVCDAYAKKYPEAYQALCQRMEGHMSENVDTLIYQLTQHCIDQPTAKATRKWSQQVLQNIAPEMPSLFGGSADLTGSNNTDWTQGDWRNYSDQGNYLSYGVREFGMAGILNGMALHQGFKPYGGTFLVFSDYARNAIRMSALMRLPVIYVLTHDSIGLGEDGPTHQPIEHLPSLRLIPNLFVWRPADGVETAIAWQQALLSKHHPTVLALSRQSLPALSLEANQVPHIDKGGYLLVSHDQAVITLVATGSEVHLIEQAAAVLAEQKTKVNVVSMPCVEQFQQQAPSWQAQVIRQEIPALFVEASQPDLWYRWMPKVGGDVIGLDHFGASAPAEILYQHYGLTVEAIVSRVQQIIGNKKGE